MGILSSIASDLADKAKEKAAAAVPKSGWASRKLWIFAGVALTLVWIGRGNLVSILDGLIWLTAVYLVTQALQDIVTDFSTAWVKREQIRCDAQIAIEQGKRDPMSIPTDPKP